MKRRILVDLLGYTGARGGTETYVRNLMVRLPTLMPDVEFVALTNAVGAEEVGSFFPGQLRTLAWVGSSSSSWALGEVLGANRAARREGVDLVWAPANFGPIWRGTKRVTSIHDVIYHQVRGSLRERVSRSVTSWLMNRSARSSDAIVTISKATRTAVMTHLGIESDRISVVLNGSSEPPANADANSTLGPLGIDTQRKIVLSTGNRMPHKNFEGLLRAVATIAPGERPLTVIPGSHDDDPLRPLVETLGLEQDVILPGWVTSDQLEALYTVCDVYACPSLVEGFGLPIVDALRRGCAVVANDVAVLREVGGEVVVYADATNPTDFGMVISGALDPLADTERARAIEWASRFTWDASAAGTAAVLDAQLSGRKGNM
ncbi:glycosyltransferase involved in cell wall biosynthesis [Microbacterium halimionae]|uniref:Glycosyltransferase involved in cell wall biosynthesis n=1 Tax=Microbacterium halimionae TaxID=1526413 RepID=A0A7W3JPS7_9MICO|nr:glycosyltransferase family 1 protein [Microbacterium halimionae]MBA8816663.1 glycosyltransferase involved in cell wall biosynthesis [Microbacterium halimionae]